LDLNFEGFFRVRVGAARLTLKFMMKLDQNELKWIKYGLMD
jgi:hypothetical protein